jgi:hypothetical protein
MINFKKTNQLIEITLTYFLFDENIKNWSHHLFIIQSLMNTSIFAIIEKFSKKTIYEFIFVNSLNIITDFISFDSTQARKDVNNIAVWSQTCIKRQFDHKYLSIIMKVNDYVLLHLHKDYFISFAKISKRKLNQQYADSFRILKKIENLSYCLNFLAHWKVYFVVSITQLQSISNFVADSYKKSCIEKLKIIYIKKNKNNIKFSEVNCLISKKIISREIEYLLRWKEYKLKHNEWRSISKLQNAKNLIHDYEIVINNVIVLSKLGWP